MEKPKMKCPRCNSTHISNREVGKRTGATIGGLVAAAVGTATALRGAQVGAALGAAAGPAGVIAGGLGGVIVASIFAGSAGCAVGSLVGNLADSNFLDNRACLDCGFTFREPSEVAALNVQFTATADPGSRFAAPSRPPAEPTHFHED
jgi:hypothetical protein